MVSVQERILERQFLDKLVNVLDSAELKWASNNEILPGVFKVIRTVYEGRSQRIDRIQVGNHLMTRLSECKCS